MLLSFSWTGLWWLCGWRSVGVMFREQDEKVKQKTLHENPLFTMEGGLYLLHVSSSCTLCVSTCSSFSPMCLRYAWTKSTEYRLTQKEACDRAFLLRVCTYGRIYGIIDQIFPSLFSHPPPGRYARIRALRRYGQMQCEFNFWKTPLETESGCCSRSLYDVRCWRALAGKRSSWWSVSCMRMYRYVCKCTWSISGPRWCIVRTSCTVRTPYVCRYLCSAIFVPVFG